MWITAFFLLGVLSVAFAILVPLNYKVYPEVKRPWRGAYALAISNAVLPIFLAAIWFPSFSESPSEWIAAIFPAAGLYILSGRYAQIARQLKSESQTQTDVNQPVSES